MKIALLLLLVWTALLYAPLRSAPFVYEDENWRTSTAPIAWRVPGRPLSTWSLRQTADDPGTAHLVNLGLHLTTGVLVALVGSALAGPLAGAIAAGLVLLHPLNSEAVSYVSARTDLLMTVGVLLAVWGALRSWPVMALGLIIAALSKESGLVALPIALAVLWLWRSAYASTRWLLRVSSVAVVLLAALTMPTWGPWLSLNPATGGSMLPLSDFLARQSTALMGLLSRVVWPVNFTIDHDWLAVSALWQGLAVGSLCVLLGLTALGLRHRWTWTLGLAWMGLSVAPRFVARTSELLNEHQFYLAMSGLAIGLGCVVGRRT